MSEVLNFTSSTVVLSLTVLCAVTLDGLAMFDGAAQQHIEFVLDFK